MEQVIRKRYKICMMGKPKHASLNAVVSLAVCAPCHFALTIKGLGKISLHAENLDDHLQHIAYLSLHLWSARTYIVDDSGFANYESIQMAVNAPAMAIQYT